MSLFAILEKTSIVICIAIDSHYSLADFFIEEVVHIANTWDISNLEKIFPPDTNMQLF